MNGRNSISQFQGEIFTPLFYFLWLIQCGCCYCSATQSCPTLCDHMDCSTPGFPVHHQLLELLKLMSFESVMPSTCLILCHPLLLLPSIFPSIRVFSNESALGIRWPKYWSFSFSNSPSNEYSGLISFRIDWFDLLAVQGTLKSLLQHHSTKASILWCTVVTLNKCGENRGGGKSHVGVWG